MLPEIILNVQLCEGPFGCSICYLNIWYLFTRHFLWTGLIGVIVLGFGCSSTGLFSGVIQINILHILEVVAHEMLSVRLSSFAQSCEVCTALAVE